MDAIDILPLLIIMINVLLLDKQVKIKMQHLGYFMWLLCSCDYVLTDCHCWTSVLSVSLTVHFKSFKSNAAFSWAVG